MSTTGNRYAVYEANDDAGTYTVIGTFATAADAHQAAARDLFSADGCRLLVIDQDTDAELDADDR